jgi:AraC-like DNA-binding protein
MKPVSMVRAVGAQVLATFLDEIGAPAESLWRRAGLPARALHEPESLIPLRLQMRFAEEAALGQGIDNLGLLAAQRFDIGALGIFGRGIRQSLTLRDAIATIQNTQPAMNSGVRFWLLPQEKSVRFVRRVCDDEGSFHQADLFVVGQLIKLVRAAAGPEWRPAEVDLQSPGGAEFKNFEMLSEARIRGGCRAAGISFPKSLLGRRLEWPAGPASPVGADEREAWLSSSPPNNLRGSLRALIGSLLRAGRAGVGDAADAAGLSIRSFQRRLAESGISFSQLLDETRFALATRLLENFEVKIIEVASELDYSDPAHFTRAFRRWSSISPRQYRRLRSSGHQAQGAIGPR